MSISYERFIGGVFLGADEPFHGHMQIILLPKCRNGGHHGRGMMDIKCVLVLSISSANMRAFPFSPVYRILMVMDIIPPLLFFSFHQLYYSRAVISLYDDKDKIKTRRQNRCYEKDRQRADPNGRGNRNKAE